MIRLGSDCLVKWFTKFFKFQKFFKLNTGKNLSGRGDKNVYDEFFSNEYQAYQRKLKANPNDTSLL